MNKLYELSRSQIEYLIDEYVIGNNAIRDRKILKDNLIDGLSQYQLSEKYNLSLPAIKSILRKRKQILFKHI